MATEWWAAPEVEEIAEKLIAEHHQHLADVPVRYVFRDQATSSRGRTVLGKARRIGGLNAHLVGLVGRQHVDGDPTFFVVEIASDMWRVLEQPQRVALVDHELCHLDIDHDPKTDERKLVLRGHDLEEFRDVVERHGLWREDLELFAQNLGQLTIDDQLAQADDDAATVVQFRTGRSEP